ncbi:MAG: PAS domain S-box protein [Gemmatimonadetes bacterium]|nr:PAS domain S-box protein [Gemmatimonadota bacterium]
MPDRERVAHADEERFRLLFEDAPTMYFEVDAAGTIVSVNGYGAEQLGYTVAELTGRPLTDVVHEADRDAVRRHLEECARTPGRVCRGEFRKVRKDGSILWVREVVHPVRLGDGEPTFLVVCDDVTDAKRLEAEREQILARERFLAEATRVLASSIDYETTLQTVARLALPVLADFAIADIVDEAGGFRRIVARHADPAKDALAREARRFPPDPSREEHPVNRAIRTGRSQIVSGEDAVRASAHDPEHLDLMRRLAPRSVLVVPLIARGRAVGAVQFITLEDGSARDYRPEDIPLAEALAGRAAIAIENAGLYREAEQRAREERALREAVGAVGAALTTEEMIRRLATSAVEATGARGAFVTRIDAERGAIEIIGVAGEIPRPQVGGATYDGTYTRAVVEAGEPLILDRLDAVEGPLRDDPLARACPDCSALVLPLIAEQPIGALFLVRGPEHPAWAPEEITRARTFAGLAALAFRRLQILEESEHRRGELERITESRARLIRGFSHDVKNPLGAADGYAQLLEAGNLGELDERQREGVRRIRRSIQTAVRLIQDLLDVARAETGEIKVERARTDVARLVREVAEEFRAQATAAGLTLECRADDAVFADTDAIRVRQIVGNLVSNAVKYTPKGRVTLEVALRDGAEEFRPGEWVAVRVSDTGLGIPEDKRERVFQEFTRLHPEARDGAGVGLANSRRIARLLGGDITLRSEVGRGSTFTLWLPVAA